MSLGISCCQPPNRSAISNNTYSASFDGAKDAAYTAKYSQPPEMKEGRGKGKGKGRDGNKGRGGRGRGAASWQGGGQEGRRKGGGGIRIGKRSAITGTNRYC